MKSVFPQIAALEVIFAPLANVQRSRRVRRSSAYTRPFQAPKKSTPSFTIGDDSIGEPIRLCQRRRPVRRSSTRTIPSMPWTTTSSPTTAGDEAIFPPGGSWVQTRLPVRMSSATIVPR